MKITPTEAQGRDLLLEILGFARPHDSPCEVAFAKHYLDTIPGMERDAFGNRFLTIGDTNVAWSCHIDTVARRGGPQAIAVDYATGTISLRDKQKKCSLGADDGVGIWIMLEMIRHQRPGLYLFHRGEERGGLGSRWLAKNTPERLKGIDVCMAFDRAGYEDVITHQASGMTASDAFAQSFADQMNELGHDLSFRPDDTGVYTDSSEYADLVAECSNLSVGYFGQHSREETQNLYFAERVLDAMLSLDVGKLVVSREPGDYGYPNYGAAWGSSRGFTIGHGTATFHEPTPLSELADICSDQPQAVAAILEALGYTPTDLWADVTEQLDSIADKRLEEELKAESDPARAYLRSIGVTDDDYSRRWEAA